MAGTRKDTAAALGCWRPLLSRQSADKGPWLMVQTFIYSAVWRGSVDEGGQERARCRRKALRSILACIPRLLLTFCTGTLGYFPVLIDTAKLCWQLIWRQPMWPKEALRFSFEGSRGVSNLRWAELVVSNPPLSRSSTP
jgi:hypothetical protein